MTSSTSRACTQLLTVKLVPWASTSLGSHDGTASAGSVVSDNDGASPETFKLALLASFLLPGLSHTSSWSNTSCPSHWHRICRQHDQRQRRCLSGDAQAGRTGSSLPFHLKLPPAATRQASPHRHKPAVLHGAHAGNSKSCLPAGSMVSNNNSVCLKTPKLAVLPNLLPNPPQIGSCSNTSSLSTLRLCSAAFMIGNKAVPL